MKDCPVCKRPDLADGLEHCPQCNADLECFDLLDALQEKSAAQAPPPPIPATVDERSAETGDRPGELHGSSAPSAPETPKTGWAAGSALVLLLLLVPLTAFVGNRNIGERVDRLENRLASTGSRTGPSPQEWFKLYSEVQTLTTRMRGVEQLLSSLMTQQTKGAAEARRERSRLEGGLIGIGEQVSRFEAQLAALGRRQDAGKKELKETMTELSATMPPPEAGRGFTPQSGRRLSLGGPSIAATPAQAAAFTDYRAAASAETLWQISRRVYGRGIYYPVLLEDNPGLAIHGQLEGRILRIARQREHVQKTYRRLVFSKGGRTLFRYRVKAGDSWRSLARAFHGNERRAGELSELNGTPHPEAGQRVLIPLD